MKPEDYLKSGLIVMDSVTNLMVERFQTPKHLFTGDADEDEYSITLPSITATGGRVDDDGSVTIAIPPYVLLL